ncbi:MAG: serine/threonine protein kinase [Myxococcales bacterium]|nr:serine/threonine protein kinase [Myxococcales bacterium]
MDNGAALRPVTEEEIQQWAAQVRDYTGRDSLASYATLVPDAVKRFNCLYVDGERENRCWVKAHVANRYIVGAEARDRRFIRSCLEALVLENLTKYEIDVAPRFFGSVYHLDDDGKFTHLIFQQNLNDTGYQELSKLAGQLEVHEMLDILEQVFLILQRLNEIHFTIPVAGLPPAVLDYFQQRSVGHREDTFEVHGLAHCDIRPENIFVKFEDGAVKVKLVDFELAKFLSSTSYDQTDFDKTPMAATLAGVHFQQYACLSAFKQYNNRVKHFVNIQTDLFSVGVVMIYLMLLETPGNFVDESFFEHLKRYLRDFDPGYCEAMGFPHILEATASDLNDLYFFFAPFLFGGSEKPLKSNIPLMVLFEGFLRSLEESPRYGPLFREVAAAPPFHEVYEKRHTSFWSALCARRFMAHPRLAQLPELVRVRLYDLVVSMTAPTIEQRADRGLNPYPSPKHGAQMIRDVRFLWRRLTQDAERPMSAKEVDRAARIASDHFRQPGVVASREWHDFLLPLACSADFPAEINQQMLQTIADDPIFLNHQLVNAVRSATPRDIPRVRELLEALRRHEELPPTVLANLRDVERLLES